MRKLTRRIIRCLALFHYAWGMALILLAMWCVIAALMVLPYMSSGTIWSNLLTSLQGAAWQAFLPGTLGVWMVIIGCRAWTGYARLRKTLLLSHGILFLPGLLATVIGVSAMHAAETSTARGGGLLSPFALVPLVIGLCMVTLATISILMALTAVPKQQKANRTNPHQTPA